MEEKEILDTFDHPSIMNNRAIVKWRILSTLLLGVFILMLFPNCSLPKIVVLKDPLTPEEHLNLGLAYEKKGLRDSAIQ
jgi:hypothetical protein